LLSGRSFNSKFLGSIDRECNVGRLNGRVAIVTGAAQGIGAAYAKALASEGACLALCDVQAPDAAVREIQLAGGEAIGMTCDVTDPKAVAHLVAETERAFGNIHVLVNNAGLFASLALKPMSEIGSDEWDRVMAVNVRGSFECAKAVLPVMRRQQYGKIINVGSGTVFKGVPLLLHYVSSKGAVVAMTRAMAREVGKDGIRVNCIAPGLVMSEGVIANSDWAGAVVANNVASRCIQREATPEDVTGTVVFLASADSDFMTGQTVVVDGGSVVH
jgi:NAD(P)-dependent dehydrogenase (short-subunit alcohol dehydrogenase family)